MYTTDGTGLVNTYAVEVPIYYAEYPSFEQQRRYALQGAVAILFVGLLVLSVFGVS